jgi:hypothetical protein
MIVLSESQRRAVAAELSGAALRRLAKRGIPLNVDPELIRDHAAVLDLNDETPVIDSDGHIWLATRPFGDDVQEVWLCPFNDRMAYQVSGNGAHATHPTAVPAFPLEILDLPA